MLLRILVPVVILALGLAVFVYFKASAPQAQRGKPRQKDPPLVKVMTVQKTDAAPIITAMGTVVPFRQIILRPRVSGEIVKVSQAFVPGGMVTKGEEIVQLDPRDYRIALKKKTSALDKARADLALEKGNQQAAREELRMFQKSASQQVEDMSLALRQPQRNKAEAEVDSAQAELDQARLDLSRTTLKAPFNALIAGRKVNLGSEVNVGEELATLVDTDTYWVKVQVPIDRLSYLKFDPDTGSLAKVVSQTGNGQWTGRAVRITGQVDEKALMAVVIVAVSDPLGLKESTPIKSRLLLNDYVQVDFQGRLLKDIVRLPRKALRADNTIWLASNGTLDMREVGLAWKDRQSAFISSGLQEEELVIVSDMGSPIKGMAVTLPEPSQQSHWSKDPQNALARRGK
jgi:RND family efflux transporter MFP subunit